MGTGEYYMMQDDGCPPAILAGGSAPGESGVAVVSLRFLQGLHFKGTPDQHLIWFQSPMQNVECRMADRILCHDAPAGSLAICPAGMDCAADAGQGVDTVIVSVDPARLALAATEDFAPDAKLMERLCGYDEQLLNMARTLVARAPTTTAKARCSGAKSRATSSRDWWRAIFRGRCVEAEGRSARTSSSGCATT